ncbi:MAG: MBOAT family protein [Clostridiales bacterium]|nr:MBOAT family protein [Clostridiales bacterium]
MLFNSYIFILIFLPLALLLWHGANHFGKYKLAQVFMIGMSLWFYGYFNPSYILIILASILGNYLISMGIERFRSQKLLGILGIVFNLSLLFYFKYYDFFVENVNNVFHLNWALKNIVLPLGISFFTFQQISFIADRMMGKAEHYKLVDYMLFVTYFPQLIAGPIVSHRDLVPQFKDERRRHFSYENTLMGIRLFMIGLGKKVLIADELGKVADSGFSSIASLDSVSALVVMLAYTFQIFFDFSGYSDMALGLGYMMNLELPQNFDSPYKSNSVKEFWKRWHITLNAFLTQYVYIPLGGGRVGKAKKIRNTMIVFLLSGIWHGANWTFILWGALHGAVVSLENLTFVEKIRMRLGKKVSWIFTFAFLNLAFVLFRSNSISEASRFYGQLFSFTNNGYLWSLPAAMAGFKNYPLYLITNHFGGYDASRVMYFIWMLGVFLLAAFLCTQRSSLNFVKEKKATAWEMWGFALVLCLCILSFSDISTFLYFNF